MIQVWSATSPSPNNASLLIMRCQTHLTNVLCSAFSFLSLSMSECFTQWITRTESLSQCWVWCVWLNLGHSVLSLLWLCCEWWIILFILMHHRNPDRYIHPLIGLMSVISQCYLCQVHFCSTDGVQNMWVFVIHTARNGFITDTRKSADCWFWVELLQIVGLHQGAP